MLGLLALPSLFFLLVGLAIGEFFSSEYQKVVLLLRVRPSRATAGPGETFSPPPPNIFAGPLRENIFEPFLFKMVHSGVLHISERRRPPNVAGPGVAYPPLPHSLDGPAALSIKC